MGVVSSVNTNTGQMFAEIRATPSAQLDRGRNVLLLFSAKEREKHPHKEVAPPADTDTTSTQANKIPDTAATPATPRQQHNEDGDDEERPNYSEYR